MSVNHSFGIAKCLVICLAIPADRDTTVSLLSVSHTVGRPYSDAGSPLTVMTRKQEPEAIDDKLMGFVN